MNKVFIIAEAGVNHNGQLEMAFKLVDAAKKAGADAVKFQFFKATNLVTKNAGKAEYQKELTDANESQLEMIKKLELTGEQQKQLLKYCETKNIQFLSSAFDVESAMILNEMGLEIFKIPSGEITNMPYLRTIGGFKKNVILSTGMATLGEVEQAIDILTTAGTKRDHIILLHCTSEYPAPFNEVNLQAMVTLEKAFKIKVGYSDHTKGIEIPVAAVALGATVIEKHFTLDRNLPGPDHKASLEPEELRAMVKAIRNVQMALGDGIKRPSPSELKNREIVRKSIVARRAIKKGEIFTENNITVKRPGNGLSPMYWDDVLGKTAPKDFREDELIVL